ncbi:MAG: NAD(P)/FAD-dependent oxidoreductase [Acidimicrobiia bacterium]|nr:NAD(P)/FAD-dependent oxidoreductase [Acidimicrobiia bacterium]
MTRPRVVVVGAGFGGLCVARHLAGKPVDVTVVDRNNFHQFLPLLYQVATCGLNAADVAYPVRGIVRDHANVRFRHGTVTAVDWERRVVAVEDGELAFDHLVVAAGATADFFGIDGAAEHSLPLYTLQDAVALRNHVLGRFEAADADPALVEDGALTFVVAGGGATGVEVAGALVELFDVVLRRDFPDLEVERARVVLVEMGDDLLPPFTGPSRTVARSTLEDRGVEVRTGQAVVAVEPTRVRLRSGEAIAAHTLVWGAGVRAGTLADVLAASGVPVGRGGRIAVEPSLRIPGHPEAFAIGDIAATADGRGGFLPGVAQVAMQGGKHVAGEILGAIEGRPPRSFRYHDKGSMATIGRRAAVAEVPLPFRRTLRLRGTLGWLAWLGLHLLYLIGFRNRLSVLLNWAWNYATWDRGPRLIFGSRPRR